MRFAIQPADIDEAAIEGEPPEALVERLSYEKARAVLERQADASSDLPLFVLGADTVVVLDSGILGKPDDEEHAADMLACLVGRVHTVLTGVTVIERGTLRPLSRVVSSRVEMRDADPGEIQRYAASGEGLDKAGAYAIQGRGGGFVTRVAGSESNVIGLPLDETLAMLREAGAFSS